MKIIKVSVLISLFLFTHISLQAQTTPAEIFQKGLENYFGAKFDEGIKYFEEYIKVMPNDSKGYSYKGLCYQGKKNFPRAIEDFSKVISLLPSGGEGYINRGNTFVLSKNYSSAETDFKDAIRYDPNNIEGYIGMSRSYIAQKKYGSAEKILSSAIAVEPKNARLYIVQSYVNMLEGDTVKIIDNVAKAMYYDSSVVFTNHKRELLQIKLDNYKAAISIADQKIQKNPNSYMAYFSRGIIYYFMNSFQKASADLKKCEELSDGSDKKLVTLIDLIKRSIDRNSTK